MKIHPAALKADRRVLDLMKQYGGDPSKEHDVDFFFFLPTEEAAYEIAQVLKKLEFNVNVHPSHGTKPQWSCIATIRFVPDISKIEKNREWMTELAESLEGKYDGWETGFEPGE